MPVSAEVRFLCPFCPAVMTPGEVHAVSDADGESFVSHTQPTCARFDAIDLNVEDAFADFLAACRAKLAETAPS